MKNFLYALLKILNDVSAVRRGRVGKRIKRRAAGRLFGKALRRIK
jgi:hypothetical protein